LFPPAHESCRLLNSAVLLHLKSASKWSVCELAHTAGVSQFTTPQLILWCTCPETHLFSVEEERPGTREMSYAQTTFPLIYIVGLVLLSGCKSTAASTPQAASAATNAPVATLTATSSPGAVTVRNPDFARQLFLEYVQANDVWVSGRSAAPQQVTHLNLSTQPLDWSLTWSADQTKFLATESIAVSSGTEEPPQVARRRKDTYDGEPSPLSTAVRANL
jgi:hypothetical protein